MNAVKNTVCFGAESVSIEDVVAISCQRSKVSFTDSPSFWRRVDAGVEFLERLLTEDGAIYGVTTGYGDSCTVAVPPHLVPELPLHLTRFHGCGLGDHFSKQETRAILASRLASLAQGYSGVSRDLLELLREFINRDLLPLIPQEGSVGASGDLTPLSYVAAALIGERDAYFGDDVLPVKDVMARLNLAPIKLRPKEGLAVMNGTAVMTGIACIAHHRATYLAKLCTRITSMAVVGLQGNEFHFDEVLFSVKPHPGQQQIASWLRSDLTHEEMPRNSSRLQDRYSLRCAPHVIGVLQDALPFTRQLIENELNSANDNPIIDGEGEHVMHGGHFYGGHIAFAMDSMKNAVANLADLMDRQMALMMDTRFNHGLPANLSGATSERSMINHGFKAVQIGTSAWTAEALKLTMPASVFSRSTECHNQDKVSMGTIAARDCLRVLQLTEQVAAAVLLAAKQSLELRIRNGELGSQQLTPNVRAMKDDLDRLCPVIDEDRPLEETLRTTVALIQEQKWPLYG
ncbi:aromatic amino acid lyase [Corallincola holothuriorum]|uniref:tyrosine ammonia-lyase n=1 Tax=Corallincola holothuriorum TaxID=2282215 RepID=A0A368NQE0_9GAMM|nr:aromatic amino acid ammonia-lyase [Corallincola holothuriorum]RCU52787.1 aromatic amino acid lyase [Corallincola holothuriorum]